MIKSTIFIFLFLALFLDKEPAQGLFLALFLVLFLDKKPTPGLIQGLILALLLGQILETRER